MLTIICGVIFSLIISAQVSPLAQKFLSEVGAQVIRQYPPDLVIEISGGQASQNIEKPVFFFWPLLGDASSSSLPFKHTLVIDTESDFEETIFRDYNTLFLLTKNSLVAANEKGEVQSRQALKSFPDLAIDRSAVVSFIAEWRSWLKWLPSFAFLFFFWVGFLGYCLYFLWLLPCAFIFWLFLRNYKKQNMISFKKAYQISLHAATFPLLLSSILWPLWELNLSSSLFVMTGTILVIYYYYNDKFSWRILSAE